MGILLFLIRKWENNNEEVKLNDLIFKFAIVLSFSYFRTYYSYVEGRKDVKIDAHVKEKWQANNNVLLVFDKIHYLGET